MSTPNPEHAEPHEALDLRSTTLKGEAITSETLHTTAFKTMDSEKITADGYAKIESTTWDHESPTRSTLKGCDRVFDHEMDCARYERTNRDCNCYVSRIRLVKTPVGEFIPTTEENLLPHLEYRRAFAEQMRLSAERWERQAWIARGLFAAAAIGVAVLGWF